jgi:hypothetical protein
MRVIWLFAFAMQLHAETDALALLERFRPVFRISAADCDVAPASFDAKSAHPKAMAKDGTIYASAFERKADWLEVHYYHLWARDCGKGAHALDAEHVSGLLQRVDGEWKAVYWYAAAHEDTPCDVSMAGRASFLDAERSGPYVWVSHGKHASYLSDAACRSGCGADSCERTKELAARPLVLLDSEAAWVRSSRWPLRLKMASDFSEALLAALAAPDLNKLVAAKPYLMPAQKFLGAGNTGIDATGGALETGGRHTDGSLALATKKTGEALGTATRSVKRFLGMK